MQINGFISGLVFTSPHAAEYHPVPNRLEHRDESSMLASALGLHVRWVV